MALKSTMRALSIPAYTTPDKYTVTDFPVQELKSSDGVLIKVLAASINPIDVKKAVGMMRMMENQAWAPTRDIVHQDEAILQYTHGYRFPSKIGYDFSGTVVEVGSSVSKFKVGAAVYAKLPEQDRGIPQSMIC